MIRAQLPTKEGKQGIILGLEAENMRRLQAGEPIQFDADDIGLPGVTVFIFAGSTAEDMVKLFESMGMNVELQRPGGQA